VRRKRFQERLRTNYEISLSMALTDGLTGLYNRRYFEVHMQKMLQNVKATNKPLGLLYMDIDHFKKVNDTYGHGVGDEILRGFASRIKDSLRSFDLVARLGGEEFVALLPDVSTEMAYYISERLRHLVAEKPFPCAAPGGNLPITSSFGGIVITGATDVNSSLADILKRADDQLYKAKHDGRNCVYFEGKGRLNSEEYLHKPRDIQT
jgi:two-component system cell cycle response regulator